MSLDIDMSNEGQLTAVSNFFKALAEATSQKDGRITRSDILTPEAEEALKQMKVVSEEVLLKPLAPKETKEEESSQKSEDAPGPEKKKRPSATRKKSPDTPSEEDAEPETPKQGSDKPSTEAPQDLREPLRVLLAEKVDDHRATIKAELGKYNAKGISNLAVEHHAAFMDFMQNLS